MNIFWLIHFFFVFDEAHDSFFFSPLFVLLLPYNSEGLGTVYEAIKKKSKVFFFINLTITFFRNSDYLDFQVAANMS
jgi:hypothetical protein